jgi:hypothetical protein
MFVCYILYNLLSILPCHTQHMESSPPHPKTLANTCIFATFCTILITEYEKVQQFLFRTELDTTPSEEHSLGHFHMIDK